MSCEEGMVVGVGVLWKSWVYVCDGRRKCVCEYKSMRSYVNEKRLEIGYDRTHWMNH